MSPVRLSVWTSFPVPDGRLHLTPGRVENLISSQSPDFVVFNGHGREDAICGKRWDGKSDVKLLYVEDVGNLEVIIDLENKPLVVSKIIYSIACCSAMKLGLEVGGLSEDTAFIGYEEEFVLLMDKNHMCHPIKDPVAKAFTEPSNQLVLSILKGDSVAVAYRKSQNSLQKWINYFESEKVPLHESMSILAFLNFNKSNLKIHGNRNLRLK